MGAVGDSPIIFCLSKRIKNLKCVACDHKLLVGRNYEYLYGRIGSGDLDLLTANLILLCIDLNAEEA